MRLRALPLLSCILFAAPLVAQATDLQIFLAADKTAVKTGERFHATIRVRNVGAGVANEINVLLQPAAYLVDAHAPEGWICTNNTLFCHTSALAKGAEAEIVVTLLAPNNHASGGSTLRLDASVQGEGDTTHDNNHATVTLQLSNSGTIADLGVLFPMATVHVEEGEPAALELAVTNFGVDVVDDVLLIVQPANSAFSPPTPEGPGWSCMGIHPRVECRLGRLAAGATAPLTMAFPNTPAHPALMSFTAHVSAEGNLDPKSDNDFAAGWVTVASADSWRRLLLPLASQDVPGANGALWRTKTTMMIADTNPAFELSPHPCEYIILHCFGGYPHGVPFDPTEADVLLDPLGQVNGGSQFFYTLSERAPALRVNSRVFDITRESDTAGSEIPIARDDDFSSATISLLGIPIRAESRYTLRVYDYDAIDGARVIIRVFADGETEPRASFDGVLRVADQRKTTLARLPVRPAYLQLDPAQLASLDDADMMRIDIQPFTPGMRIWAFVSVTDNDTHHVTTFSAQ